jgi:hypothetical protein
MRRSDHVHAPHAPNRPTQIHKFALPQATSVMRTRLVLVAIICALLLWHILDASAVGRGGPPLLIPPHQQAAPCGGVPTPC